MEMIGFSFVNGKASILGEKGASSGPHDELHVDFRLHLHVTNVSQRVFVRWLEVGVASCDVPPTL